MAGSADTAFVTGAIVAVTEESDGVYSVKQVNDQLRIPKTPEGLDSVIPIDWSYGPLTIKGSIDLSTLSISVQISVIGITIGSFSGNLKDGLKVSVDLWAVSGSITIYLKNGNEVWVRFQLKAFGKSWDEDVKLITLPI